MTHIEALDTILKEIDNNVDKRLSKDDILTLLEEKYQILQGGNVMINHLLIDDYIWVHKEIEEPVDELDNEVSTEYCTLTSRGKIFIDAGGYSSLDKFGNEKRSLDKNMVVLTRWVAVGTIVAAIYYTIEIIIKIYNLCNAEQYPR